MAVFPTSEWVAALMEKLNSDARYARIAANWEGDMRFFIEPSGALSAPVLIYLDLWHGKCRDAYLESESETRTPAFVLKAPYENFSKVINGQLDPMQALLTRKLGLQGNMAVIMRSVPTVLDFVRCCREITTGIV